MDHPSHCFTTSFWHGHVANSYNNILYFCKQQIPVHFYVECNITNRSKTAYLSKWLSNATYAFLNYALHAISLYHQMRRHKAIDKHKTNMKIVLLEWRKEEPLHNGTHPMKGMAYTVLLGWQKACDAPTIFVMSYTMMAAWEILERIL